MRKESTVSGTVGVRSAMRWLASAAPDPETCRWEWERHPLGVMLLPAGRLWDLLVLDGGLGRPTLEVLTGLLGRPGPVLADYGDARIGFFVPPGTADRWLGTGVRAAGRGSWVAVPHPGRTGHGVRWLVLPDGSGTLNDPVVLELAMHEAAALRARRPAVND
ncbi:bifunctional DNA primase/polymerase [Streptomyces sp. XC 2026]|nr:bifunctional DNA primase/polymerase [Streptomyces sp. XC 2026]